MLGSSSRIRLGTPHVAGSLRLLSLPSALGGEGLDLILGRLADRRQITPPRSELQSLLLEELISVLDVQLEPVDRGVGVSHGPLPHQGVIANELKGWPWRNCRDVPSRRHHGGRHSGLHAGLRG